MISALHPNDAKDWALANRALESVLSVSVNCHSFKVSVYSFTKSLKIEHAV